MAFAAAVFGGPTEAQAQREKVFGELSDTEIEATMNLSKRVFDDILGKKLPRYYQTESLSILARSGFFRGDPASLRRLPRPIVALSVAYPTGQVDQGTVARLEKEARSRTVEWKGKKLTVLECVVQVDPRGAGEHLDKITIYPLKVRVLR